MSKQALSGALYSFDTKTEEHMKDLTHEETQQFLWGIFFALDSVIRLGDPTNLTPFEKENFTQTLKYNIFNKTRSLGLDSKKMEQLMGTDAVSRAQGLLNALHSNMLRRIQLNAEEEITLQNAISMVGRKKDLTAS